MVGIRRNNGEPHLYALYVAEIDELKHNIDVDVPAGRLLAEYDSKIMAIKNMNSLVLTADAFGFKNVEFFVIDEETNHVIA